MSTSLISKLFSIDGTPTAMTSVVLSDPTGTYGVKRNDTGAAVVADGTAMTAGAAGVYTHTFADPAADLTYTYWIEFVYDGKTHWIEGGFAGGTSTYVPVTTAEQKLWMRVDHATDDVPIAALVVAATQYAEQFTRRRFIDQTEIQYFTDFADPMKLYWSPMDSATTIYYTSTAGVNTLLAGTVYDDDTTEEPPLIRLAYGQSWPSHRGDANGITVTYVAGYGVAADVPEGIKTAIKMLAAHWYEHREAVVDVFGGGLTEVPMAVDAMLWPYRVLEVG